MDLREDRERLDGAERDRAVVDPRVQLLGQHEDLEAVADDLAGDLQLLADALARQTGLEQPREGVRLLDRGVIGAMEVRRQRAQQAAVVGVFARGHDDRHLGKLGQLRGAVAALAVDELELPVRRRASHQQRLQDTAVAHRRGHAHDGSARRSASAG